MTAGLWWAGTHIQSSSQAAAQARPPAKAIITAPLREMVVRSTLTLTGSVAGGKTEQIGPPTLSGGVAAVVTRVSVSKGTFVRAGELLADVSGRPIFVLSGRFPMYRPLSPGTHGPDVAELQAGLQKAGFAIYDSAGYFGPSTLAALQLLYSRGGYPLVRMPATTGGTDAQASEPIAPRSPSTGQSSPTAKPTPTPTARPTASPTAAPSPAPTPTASRRPRTPSPVTSSARPASPSPSATGRSASGPRTVPVVPVGEITFVPKFPAMVAAVKIAVGPDPSGSPIMTLSSGKMTIEASLNATSPGAVRIGMAAVVTSQGLDHPFDARVTAVPAGGGTVVKLAPRRSLAADLAGETASVVITLAKTRGSVLAAPVSALRANASGSTALGVLAEGRIRLVTVQTGRIGDGYAELIDPPAALHPGVKVAVGHG